MQLLRNYKACNSKTLSDMLTAQKKEGFDGVLIEFDKSGGCHQGFNTIIVHDWIKQPGLHDISAHMPYEMSFDDYNNEAMKTAVYPGQGSFIGLQYVALKGAGEAGEFAENVGKAMRDDDVVIIDEKQSSEIFASFSPLTEERRLKLLHELGDELWYFAAKCRELGEPPSKVARMNIEKLSRRAIEGKIKGSGSDR